MFVDDDWRVLWEGYACWKSPDEIEVNIADCAWALNIVYGFESDTALTLARQMIKEAIRRAPTCRFGLGACPWWYPRIAANWEVRF